MRSDAALFCADDCNGQMPEIAKSELSRDVTLASVALWRSPWQYFALACRV